VRAKLAALGLAEADVSDAVRWARSEAVAPAAAEPPAAYARTRGAVKANVKKKASRRT